MWLTVIEHWLWFHFCYDQVWVNFWGGIASDLGEVTLVGACIGLYRKHNCQVKGCWRLSKYQVKGTTHIVCRKHHPDDDLTAEQVLADHAKAKAAATHHPSG
jgi:hypothetical protein